MRAASSSVPGRGMPPRRGGRGAGLGTPGRWTAWARARAGRGMRRDRRTRPAPMIVTGLTWAAAGAAGPIEQSITAGGHLSLAIHLRSDMGPGRAVRARAGESPRPAAGRPGPTHRGEPSRSGPVVGEAGFPAPRTPGRERFLRRESRSPVPEARRSAGPSGAIDRGRVPGATGRRREELVTRLVHGGRRVEAVPRPVPIVQDHDTARGPGDRAGAATRPHGTPDAGGAAIAARSAVAGSVAPVDLEQLTDQVVTRLDARLIAHRERFGRGI